MGGRGYVVCLLVGCDDKKTPGPPENERCVAAWEGGGGIHAAYAGTTGFFDATPFIWKLNDCPQPHLRREVGVSSTDMMMYLKTNLQ